MTATETTGTTTATAIVPPADRPPLSLSELGNEGTDVGTAVPVTELVSEPVLTGSLVPVSVMITVVRDDVIVMVVSLDESSDEVSEDVVGEGESVVVVSEDVDVVSDDESSEVGVGVGVGSESDDDVEDGGGGSGSSCDVVVGSGSSWDDVGSLFVGVGRGVV